MRVGALRNIIKILDFYTMPNGSGGLMYAYYDATEVQNQFVGRVQGNAGTIETTDCGSDFLNDFLDAYEVWGEVNQKQGGRSLDGSKIELQNFTEIILRYDDVPYINKKWLLEFEGRRFTIHSYYIVYEKKKKVVINAVEIK